MILICNTVYRWSSEPVIDIYELFEKGDYSCFGRGFYVAADKYSASTATVTSFGKGFIHSYRFTTDFRFPPYTLEYFTNLLIESLRISVRSDNYKLSILDYEAVHYFLQSYREVSLAPIIMYMNLDLLKRYLVDWIMHRLSHEGFVRLSISKLKSYKFNFAILNKSLLRDFVLLNTEEYDNTDDVQEHSREMCRAINDYESYLESEHNLLKTTRRNRIVLLSNKYEGLIPY